MIYFCSDIHDYNLRYSKTLLHIFPHLHGGNTNNPILYSYNRGHTRPRMCTHAAFTHPCKLEYHLGCNVPTSLKTTITTHMTAWELHPVDKYVSCLLLITEISLVFSSDCPVNTQGAK